MPRKKSSASTEIEVIGMLFKFAFDMIKNNKIMSTAIVLQLAISIMLLNVTLAMYNDVALRLNVLSDFDRSKTLFYMSKTILSEENEYENLKKLTDGAVVEPVYTCGFVNKEDNINIYATAYGDKTSEKLSYKMVSGQWYADAPKEKGVINVVAYEGSRFKTGDVYETALYSSDSEKEGKLKVKLKITGIVNNKVGVITGATSSNVLETDILFQEVDFQSILTENWFLLNYNDVLNLENVTDEVMIMPDAFIFTKSDDNSKYIKDLSNYGNILTFQSIIDNSDETLAEKLHTVYPIAAGVLMSGVIGAECLIILNNFRSRKRFAIYYLCGMRWGECITISVIQLTYLVAAAVPCSWIVFNLLNNFTIMNFNNVTLYDTNNIFVTIGIIVLMYAVSVISTKLMVSGSSPKDYLKD